MWLFPKWTPRRYILMFLKRKLRQFGGRGRLKAMGNDALYNTQKVKCA